MAATSTGPIIIIGGGIGGLTAAIALQRHGLAVHVHEAAPELRAVGAGIAVPTNAMQVLDGLGVADAVRSAGHPIRKAEIMDYRAGLLQSIDLDDLSERYGQPSVAIHRSALHAVLAAALAPGTLRLGREFISFSDEASAPVRVTFADGTTAEGGVLVGADGLRSRVREQIFPGVRLRYSGQSSYRAVVPFALPADLVGTSREIWAPGRRFGFTGVGCGLVYWYATWDSPAGEEDGPGAARRRLEGFAAEFPEPVAELVRAADEDSVVRTDLHDIAPMDSWHRGRVVLLGDAAHATTPNLGQGGAQAIEDAPALARALASGDQVDTALARYESARTGRTRMIVNRSWHLGKVAHWQNAGARTFRNFLLRTLPASAGRRQVETLYRVNG